MVIFPLEGCNLQVAGQNLAKKCPERFTDLPKLLKTEHYNDVLVISYSSQGNYTAKVTQFISALD